MESYISKEVHTEETVPLRRKLNLNSGDIFSTPPSELRREISHLRDEIIETHEFHDLELKIFLEEHNIADSKNDITIAELQKSLKNAEDIILDTKKEISHLNTLNQDLQQLLKEESYKSSNLKEQYENQISQLKLTLKKKSFDIENLEKDKKDYEFYVQLLRKNYEEKICELRIALEHNCEKNGNEEKSINASERELKNEYDKTEELKKVRCAFEEEIKKLKDEHNDKVKSFELIIADLKQTNDSLSERLREANEAVERLKEPLRILEDEVQSLPKNAIIPKRNDSNGERCRCSDELEFSASRNVNSPTDKGKLDSIRKEFEGHKVSESKDSFHLLHRTVRYLGALCSQLEDSGSSLNLSNSSFDSFNENLPSSTVMEDFTEVEISALNDATVCNDPLALTRDNTLQTPFKTPTTIHKHQSKTDFRTPLDSVSKPFRVPLRTPTGNVKKQFYPTTPGVTVSESNLNETELLKLKTSLAMKNKEICEMKDMFMKNLNHSEEILTNSLKSISHLEERILKLENLSADFKVKKEMLTAENFNIQELLTKSTEELAEIRRKLIVEVTSLNPQLEGSLSDIDVSTLLSIFLDSIMESCKKMPEELYQKFFYEMKALNEKIEIYERKIFESEKEIDRLKEVNGELLSEKHEIQKQMSIKDEQIRILHLESSELQYLRINVNDLEKRLEKSDDILKAEIYLKENLLKDHQKLKNFFENLENDNHDLKLKLEEAEKTIEGLRINLTRARRDHLCIVTKEELSELQDDEEQLNTLESILEKYKKTEMLMHKDLEALNSKLTACEAELIAKTELIETVTFKLEEANTWKLKCDDIISELKEKLINLEKENIALKSLEPVLEEYRDKEKSLSGEIENINMKLKSTEVNLAEKTELIAKLTTEVEEAQDIKNKDEKIISELRTEIGKFEQEVKRLRDFVSKVEKLKEIECNMCERMEVLTSKLLMCEDNLNKKTVKISKLIIEVEEAKDINVRNEEVISDLRKQIEELERSRVRAEELETLFKNSKDTEKVLSEKVKDLTSRLEVSEVALMQNLELVAETSMKLEKVECINAEYIEVISDLKKQLKNLENEKRKVEELQRTVKELREVEEILLKKVEDVTSKLRSSEAEKMELELKILAEMEEASKTKSENEKIMALLRLKVGEFDREKAKLEELEDAMVSLKEKEKLMSERMENLNSRLLGSEEVVNQKTDILAQMCNEITKAKLMKAENEDIISTLQKELEMLRNLQHTRDAARQERNEKETLIEDLHNKLNELNSEIECLREKLAQADSNLKLHEEKVIRLGEIESDLITYKKNVDELKLDCEKMKELENDLFRIISELERKNKELENRNSDLLQKLIDSEKLSENNKNEINILQESLSKMEDMLRINKEESEKLQAQLGEMETKADEKEKAMTELNSEVTELRKFKSENSLKCRHLEEEKEILMQKLKEAQERTEEMQNIIWNVENKLNYQLSNGPVGKTEKLNSIVDKIDKLLLSHNEEVENLRQELKSSTEIINNLQIEIDNYNKKVFNASKSESFLKPKEIFFERMTPLKSTPVTKQSRQDMSPPHKSQRLEKLETLNDLLNGTLQKIITALNIPVNVNFFSVDCYEASETQVMKYITSMKCNKNDLSQPNETRNEINITSEKYEEICRNINDLKTCLSSVLKYLGLPENVLNSYEIISQFEKIKLQVKGEFLERIAVLRQDNQHLDDDNSLLQKEAKKLVELVSSNQIKISALEKSEEHLKAEVENLRSELLKYQGKFKISKKNDLCNRKLDRLEELHQSLIDLLKKILTMMDMENVQKLNLFTPRTFDIESRKIFDHVNNWMLKKLKEVQELKSQITELDEECESYAKKIKEDSQQIYKAWEEIRTLKLEKEKLEEEVKLLKCDLEKLKVEGDPIHASGMGRDWKKEVENLKEKNILLTSQITALNNELDQSKKKREELDEECESLAVAVKLEGEQRIKIWEEFKNELKTLNGRIEELEQEKNCLKSEKEDLQKKIQANDNGTKNDCQDAKACSTCNCRKQSKELKELRSEIVVRDMKILELQQLNEKNVVRKTKMEALEKSLSAVKKKLAEENELNQKLQAEIKELSNQKVAQESEILGKIRMRDYGIAAVNQIEESEKLQKLEKDNRMLKELCRTRYNEIKRLETENLSLKGHERITKNSNQMDSPIRTRAYNKVLKNYPIRL